MVITDNQGWLVREPVWDVYSAEGEWFYFFVRCLLAYTNSVNMSPDKIQPLVDEIVKTLHPLIPDENGLTHNRPALERFVRATQLACNMSISSMRRGRRNLIPNEFAAYLRRNCRGKLSFIEACRRVKNNHPMISDREVYPCLTYLSVLKMLHLAVGALYRRVDPNFVVNDKPLSEYYQNFKDHYAFETVFGFLTD